MITRKLIVIGLLLCMQGSFAANQGRITIGEDAVESSTGSVVLPSSDSGTLFFTECAQCNKDPLRLAPTTRFILNGQDVSFADFKAVFNSKAGQQFTVFFMPESHMVSRIKLSAALIKPAAPK